MTPHPFWGLGVHLAVSVALAVGLVLAGALLRYRVSNPPPAREDTYECGETPFHRAHVRIPVSFYLVALLFVLFDLEAAFLFPWVFALHHDAVPRSFVFWEMVIFLLVLFLGWVYALRKGDLAWQR